MFAMQSIVLYVSQVGSTKKYAEDIASSLSTKAVPLKKFKWKEISKYDLIIFGGWVMGGKIKGIDDFLSHYDDMENKNVIVFSSGMSIPSKEGREDIINKNVLDLYHVRYYQLRGSFDMSKLPFFQKVMLKMALKMMSNGNQGGVTSSMVAQFMEHPVDYYDQEGINKIINVAHKITNVVEAEVVK